MSTVPNITLLFWKGVRMLCSLLVPLQSSPSIASYCRSCCMCFFRPRKNPYLHTLTCTEIYSFNGTRFPDNSSPPSLFFLSFSSLKPNSKNKSAMPSTPKPTKTTLTKTANTRKLFVKKHLNLLNPT